MPSPPLRAIPSCFRYNSPVNTRQHILNLTPEELTQRLAALDMPKFRTKQIHEWIFQKRAASFEQMTNISKPERRILADRFDIFTGTVRRDLTAADGTRKIVLEWPANNDRQQPDEPLPDAPATPASSLPLAASSPSPALTECVMIPCDDDQADDFGNVTVAHRRTACLSTQVGCPVGCAFCASGLDGLKGNLTTGQVVEEALRLTHLLPPEGAGHRLSNIVFMGMGEPLANFDVTIAAVKVLMAPWAFHISGRKITVSTVGLPPQMKRLADLELPITLAISLHAPNDELRQRIIPWARKITIDQIVDAGRYYFEKTGREVTLEYIMLDGAATADGSAGGLNTLPEHARQLAAVAKRLRANVNLIYYNEVPELPFKRPAGQTVFAFQNTLRTAGINVHIRKSRGREIAAACGQLARQDRNAKLPVLDT
jgi:23S rRNA (adenine2503-C2)-methyltransferase